MLKIASTNVILL